MQKLFENTSCTRILKLFEVYLESLRDTGSLSAFWMSYWTWLRSLLGLILASREGNWVLHLAAIRQMIPWCFVYDKVNYTRFLTYYYATVFKLPIEHPEVRAHFVQGGFSVQIWSQNPFDQTIEEIVKCQAPKVSA